MNPLFTIIHPTARPDAWREVYDAWIANAVDPSSIQYILVCDERWGFHADTLGNWPTERGFGKDSGNLAVWNSAKYEHSGYVSSVNIGAAYAKGQIFIVVADDQFPCEKWDEAVSKAVEFDHLGKGGSGDFVVSVSTDTPQEHERSIMVMPILSRARYERIGHIFYPAYESMFADNEFSQHAQMDGIVIDAKDLVFPHKHWLNSGRKCDGPDKAQNSEHLCDSGEKILQRRRAEGFAKECPAKILHLMLPGEAFPAAWVSELTHSMTVLMNRGWTLSLNFMHASCAYSVRNAMAKNLMNVAPGYILWIDDDQIVTAENVLRLVEWMEKTPEASLIVGHTWIQPGTYQDPEPRMSCGVFDVSGVIKPISSITVEGDMELVEVEWTGFPCVLMRWEALQLVGKNPFNPIPAPNTELGMYGEDISFSIRLRKAGGRIFCAPDVYVPHLKLREAVPVLPKIYEAEQVPVFSAPKEERHYERVGCDSLESIRD